MSAHTEEVLFEGQAGAIECAIDWPAATPRGWALVLHPHPLQGGARDNKVVTTIARACVQHGLVAVRPNFRGVGRSEGEFDHAQGESSDMAALVSQFAQRYPELARGLWVLGGFSFGTAVAARLYTSLPTHARPRTLMLAGAAVQRFEAERTELAPDTLFIHGEQDDVVPLSETLDFVRQFEMPLVVIPDASHFFHGKLVLLRRLVHQHLAAL